MKNTDEIKVNMLGDFSISWHGNTIYDTDNRMRKIWLLTAYFIYRRNNRITQNALLDLLWDGDDDRANPQGALKTMLYRTRNMLGKLEENAGYELILSKDGNYSWNTSLPLTLDVEEFEKAYQKGLSSQNQDEKLAYLSEALNLYKGDFLPRLAMESWVVPISAHYHKVFLEIADIVLDILLKNEEWEKASEICTRSLKIEPYSENLYAALMKCQISLDKKEAAISTYETLSEMLYSNFGVLPSDETRALYREASKSGNKQAVSLDTIRDQLREDNIASGALFCDYDFFKVLYRSQARTIARSGDTIHIALISVNHPVSKELSKKSFDKAVDNLKEQIISNLRQGDVVSQCSGSQFIIMLPHANYENSCMVCGRILRAFFRKYPHSPADIRFNVLPLEPRDISF
ncbi:MAG: hypothetical protein IJP24_00085 [Firmicutes bacterium]|nr:hypothetical protein [Bacillota bacterium]